MATAKQVLDTKGDAKNFSVASTDAVLKALEIMAGANISAVMVTKDEKIIGIFTERDYSRKCELNGLSAQKSTVRDLMTEQMMTVSPDTSMDQCMRLMNQYHIRHLPVIDNDTMIGMVSMRDVVDVLLSERETEIKGLENYILGSGFAT